MVKRLLTNKTNVKTVILTLSDWHQNELRLEANCEISVDFRLVSSEVLSVFLAFIAVY